eukprot:3861779-Pleurochrysis_carterae.AAC.1
MKGQTTGRRSLYFASYSSAKWSPFGQLIGGYKSDMPGRTSSFQGDEMGCPALHISSIYRYTT